MVFFEAPHRLAETLDAMSGRSGRPAGRGLPRDDQDIRADGPWFAGRAGSNGRQGEVRGEITIVVAGALESTEPPEPRLLAAFVELEERFGRSRKDAIATVAHQYGVPKRVVFDAVVEQSAETGK